MARRKKTFDCGHTGFGSFCHRCAHEERARQQRAEEAAQRRADRDAYDAAFDADPIDLRGLPRHVVEAAREKIARIEAGTPWQEVGGKKLQASMISVPLPSWYRLLYRYDGTSLVPLAAMSHEDYNTYDFTG